MTALFPNQWQSYLPISVVFFRLIGIAIFAPVFSHRSIPSAVKTSLVVALTFAIYPLVKTHLPPMSIDLFELATAVVRELSFGLLLGFVGYITFEGLSLGAHFIGYQMGFGSASLMDPQHQSHVSTLVPLHSWLAIITFLMLDLHHGLIQLVVRSFEITGKLQWDLLSAKVVYLQLVAVTSRLFVVSIQMAAPFTLVVLIINAAIGVLAKVIPQMNVLLFSFPITLLLGVASLYLFAPEMLAYLEATVAVSLEDMLELMRAI